MSLRGYDAWLEEPYQRMYGRELPGWVEDLLDARVMVDGEEGIVEDYEAWEDEDEDGRHGGIGLIVNFDGDRRHMARDEVEAARPEDFGIEPATHTALDGTPYTPDTHDTDDLPF